MSPSASVQEAAVEPATSSFVVRLTSEHTGAWLTAVTLMVKVCGALVSTPPLAVPPLSWSTRVIVGHPVWPRRRRVGQGAGRADRRLGREERGVVVAGDLEVDGLARLVGGPGADGGGPAGDGLRPASSSTVWLAPLVKDGASLTGRDGDGEGLGGAGVDAAVGRAAVVVDAHGDRGGAVGVGGRGVGEGAGRADRRLDREEGGVVVGDDEVDGLADSSAGPALMAVAQPATDCAPESSSTVWSAPLVKDGTSLTGLTVTVTLDVFE